MEAAGEAITFVSPEEEVSLRGIEKILGHSIHRVTLPDFGYRAPAPLKEHRQKGARSGHSRGQAIGRQTNRYRPGRR